MTMLRDLGFSAIGTRLEARLHAKDLRLKAAETAVKAENIAGPAAQFVLPTTSQFSFGATDESNTDVAPEATPTISADFGVGATFRRKGMLSDVPMPVTRVDEKAVFTSFTDTEGSQEMAFDPTEIELVAKAPVLNASPETEFFPNLIDLVKKASAAAAAAPVVTTTSEAAPIAATTVEGVSATQSAAAASVVTSSVPTTSAAVTSAIETTPAAAEPVAAASAPVASSAPAAASVKAAEVALPAGAIRLPDGTLQFGYAPTGGLINRVPNVMPPVPAEFGVGATVRRKGVLSDAPMTVTAADGGIIRATVTDSAGTHIFEFPANQFDLVTRAPGT